MLTVSIGVASTDKRAFQHYAEAVAVATEMKQFTKGSDRLVLGDGPPQPTDS